MGQQFLLFGLGEITSNLGCEALIHGTGTILKQTMPDCSPIYISNGHAASDKVRLGKSSPILVEDVAPRWGPRFFKERIKRKLKLSEPGRCPLPSRLLKRADCVLSVGGDLYTFARKETNWPYPYAIVKDGNEIINKGVPYVIWCASVGPLEKAGERLGFILEHFRRCRAIIVREPGSYEYLTNTLLLKENVHLAADPAYLMEPLSFDAPFFSNGKDLILAINLSRGPVEHVYGPIISNKLFIDYTGVIEGIIDSLGIRILLVPHVGSDYGLLEEIYNNMVPNYRDRVWILPKDLGAQRTKWAVSQCDGLISMRFHCALAGIGTCTPTIVIVSTTKGRKIANDIYGNSEDYIINLHDLTNNVVRQKVEALLRNRDSIRSDLQVKLKEMRKRALFAGEVLRKVL